MLDFFLTDCQAGGLNESVPGLDLNLHIAVHKDANKSLIEDQMKQCMIVQCCFCWQSFVCMKANTGNLIFTDYCRTSVIKPTHTLTLQYESLTGNMIAT